MVAGAGVNITPVAFIIVQNNNVKLLEATHCSVLDKLVEYVPDAIEKINQLFNKKIDNDENKQDDEFFNNFDEEDEIFEKDYDEDNKIYKSSYDRDSEAYKNGYDKDNEIYKEKYDSDQFDDYEEEIIIEETSKKQNKSEQGQKETHQNNTENSEKQATTEDEINKIGKFKNIVETVKEVNSDKANKYKEK